MAAKFEKLAGFSSNEMDVREVEKQLQCVRCTKLPNPKCYKICTKCERITCDSCASDLGKRTPEEGKSCCVGENLIKGPERFLSMLLKNSYYECEFKKTHGCEEQIKGLDWEEHLLDCPKTKKPVSCYYPSCEFQPKNPGEFIGHLMRAHRAYVAPDSKRGEPIPLTLYFNEDVILDNEYRCDFTLIKFPLGNFIFVNQFSEEVSQMWISHVPSAKVPKPMKYIIVLKLEFGDGVEQLQYTQRCPAYETPLEQVVAEGKCLTVRFKELKKRFIQRFRGELMKLYVEVTVKEAEPENKW